MRNIIKDKYRKNIFEHRIKQNRAAETTEHQDAEREKSHQTKGTTEQEQEKQVLQVGWIHSSGLNAALKLYIHEHLYVDGGDCVLAETLRWRSGSPGAKAAQELNGPMWHLQGCAGGPERRGQGGVEVFQLRREERIGRDEPRRISIMPMHRPGWLGSISEYISIHTCNTLLIFA